MQDTHTDSVTDTQEAMAVTTAEEVHTTAVADHETGTEASGGVLSSLGLSPQLFLFQFINFALVVCAIWFLILKPLTGKMEERRKIIDDSLEKAKEVESKLIMANQGYQDKMDKAKVDATAVIATGHAEAKQLAETMKQDAKKEITALVAQAREKIQNEKDASMLEIRVEAAKLATAMAEKILSEKMDAKKDESFSTDMVKKIKS